MSKKLSSALTFCIVGIVLLNASLVLPWWGTHTETTYKSDYNEGVTESGMGITLFSYPMTGGSLYSGSYMTPWLFMITAFMVILGMVFGGIMAGNLLLQGNGKGGSLGLARKMGIFAMVMCFVAPAVFAIALPTAMRTDAQTRAEQYGGDYEEPDHEDPSKTFFGTYTEDEDDYAKSVKVWGGDFGWIFSFMAFIMFLMAYRSTSAASLGGDDKSGMNGAQYDPRSPVPIAPPGDPYTETAPPSYTQTSQQPYGHGADYDRPPAPQGREDPY